MSFTDSISRGSSLGSGNLYSPGSGGKRFSGRISGGRSIGFGFGASCLAADGNAGATASLSDFSSEKLSSTLERSSSAVTVGPGA